MPPDWLKTVADVAIVISVISALVIAIDVLAGRRQKMAVMNAVWPITGLYLGPIGLWAYWVMGRPQARDGSRGEKPFWQTTFVATSHCGAGVRCVVPGPLRWLGRPGVLPWNEVH